MFGKLGAAVLGACRDPHSRSRVGASAASAPAPGIPCTTVRSPRTESPGPSGEALNRAHLQARRPSCRKPQDPLCKGHRPPGQGIRGAGARVRPGLASSSKSIQNPVQASPRPSESAWGHGAGRLFGPRAEHAGSASPERPRGQMSTEETGTDRYGEQSSAPSPGNCKWKLLQERVFVSLD